MYADPSGCFPVLACFLGLTALVGMGLTIGGITAVAGLGTGLFASAEYQEAFTGNNWMLDAGMSEEWYNGLMLATAAIVTAGTVASMAGVTRYQKFGNSNWHGGWRKMRSHFIDHGKPQMGYRNV